MMKRPRLTRWTERLLNPVLGKSVVLYLRKPPAASATAPAARPAARNPAEAARPASGRLEKVTETGRGDH
jgi:hypothetical protein